MYRRYVWHFGDHHAEYSEFTGRVMAFYADGSRSLLGFAHSPEQALATARDFFGGLDPGEERFPAGYNLFPFP